jgi:hypothetical protein
MALVLLLGLGSKMAGLLGRDLLGSMLRVEAPLVLNLASSI